MDRAVETQPSAAATSPLSILVMIGLLAGPFMSMIDSNIVNVALPDISTELHSSLATVQWVVSAYLLALGVVLAGTAYLAKRFGTRRVYLLSLFGFTVTSALCALAPTIKFLIGARVLQGMMGAPLVPLAMNMLLGREEKGAQRQMPVAAGMILFLAPALGPSLGGFLIHWAGWPTIFLVNLPIGVIALVGALRLPQELSQEKSRSVHFDLTGFVLLAAGLALVSYGAAQGPQHGWLSVVALPFWASGLLLLASYGRWAVGHDEPIVAIGLLQRPQPALALTLSALVSVVLFVMLFLIPVFLQEIQGKSAVVAGLALLPQGLITGVGTILGSKLPSRWGVRLTAVLGMVILTLSTAAMLGVSVSTPVWLTALMLSGRGLALGLVIQPLLSVLIGRLPEAKVADGNTFFNVAQRVGATLGIALLATFFQVREHVRAAQVLQSFGVPTDLVASSPTAISKLPPTVRDSLANAATAGFHDVIWLLVGLSAAGVLLALFISDRAVSARAVTAGIDA